MTYKYWLFGTGKKGEEFLISGCKQCGITPENIAGGIDNFSNPKKGMIFPVYSFEDFTKIFNPNCERIIITIGIDDYMSEVWLQLYKNNLQTYVYGIYRDGKILNFEEFWLENTTSQHGEDILLKSLYKQGILPEKGFYVDVGAYHPFKYSNTYNLYTMGWCGINIDASYDSIQLFDIYRNRDTNINAGIADTDGETFHFYHFRNAAAASTCDPKIAEQLIANNAYELDYKKEIKIRNLNNILNELQIDKIDFLDIDIEHYDEKVIDTFDFQKFSPKVVLVEIGLPLEKCLESKIYKTMTSNGYEFHSYLNPTAVFVSQKVKDR